MKNLLLLGLAAVCSAQVPTPCESPKQWEGRILLYDSSKKFTEFARFAYDETNLRMRAIEEVTQGVERNFYDVLGLYKENKEYKVDLRTKKCNVTAIGKPYRRIGVPRDATFLFKAEVGPSQIPNEHLTIAAFGGNLTMEQINFRYITTVTQPDCVPVSTDYYNEATGLLNERYYDVKLGISDPEVFEPPRECM